MEFKTALNNYKNGTASNDEICFVKEELEKNQLIAEYLEEEWGAFLEEAECSAEEYKKVRKSIGKRNMVLVITSMLLVFLFLLTLVTFVGPVVEKHYWDPSVATYSEEFTDFEFMLKCFSELFVPNQTVYSAKTAKTGFATYDLSVSFAQWRDRYRLDHYNGNLIRGELKLPEGIWEYPEIWNFKLDNTDAGSGYFNTAGKALQNLPEYVMVRAYVTFPEDLNMEEVMAIFRRVGSSKLENPGILNWIGIRAQADGADIYPLCGMKPFWSYDHGSLGNINETYPFLSVWDAQRPVASSEAISEHFLSLLRYSIDQAEQGTGIFPESDLGDVYYRTVLDYIMKNGIYSYGCSITATPQQFLELMEDGTVSAVSIQDVWLTF